MSNFGIFIDTTESVYSSDDDWLDFAPNSPLANRITNSNNHSEIEKRRRDRMNELMGQLAALVPSTFCRKLDKLSLLRLALDHISTMSMNISIGTLTDLRTFDSLYFSVKNELQQM